MNTTTRIAPEEGTAQAPALEEQANASASNHTHFLRRNPFPESPSAFFDRISNEVDAKVREITQDVNSPYKETALTNLEIKADFFVAFADFCQSAYQSSGDLNPLERAIMCRRQAITLLGDRNEMKPELLGALGSLLHHRFERLGKLENVNESIQCLTRAVELTPEAHPNKPIYLNDLGLSWWSRYQQLGEQTALEKAFEYQISAIELAPDSHSRLPAFLNNLGNLWISRFEQCNNPEYLNKAIECQTKAVQLAPRGFPNKVALINNLGTSRLHRFAREGDLIDVQKVIEDQTQAIQLIPNGDPNMPGFMNNLALALKHRCERLGDLADLDKAIEYGSKTVQLTPEGHCNRPHYMGCLGDLYLRRFERLGKLADMDNAIEFHEQVIQLTPKQHKDKSVRLNSLGQALARRAERSGNLADLEKAIEYELQALSLAPEGHPDKPAWLNSLGCSYMRRFERLGDLANIDKAIEHLTQAAQLIPEQNARGLTILHNLGLAWRRRFLRLGEQTDIDNAIKYQTQAVQLTPERHLAKPGYLTNLGCSWSSRFERLGQLADIDKAIKYQSRAVELTPNHHADKHMYLNSIGCSWLRRFLKFGELPDIEQAIKCQTLAVQLTPKGHPDNARNLNNLGISLKCRYKCLGNLADLDNSIEYHTQAVDITPEGHARKPAHLVNLGDSWVRRYERLGERSDLESAQASYKRGAEHIITDPKTQIDCARKWAAFSTLLGLSPLEGYQRSFALIPQLVWVGLTIKRRYSTLTTISDLTAEAAAWAVAVEYYDLAVEWLEEGRSIVWNQILQLRTPFDDLAVVDPGLANRLKETASQLEGAGSRTAVTESDGEFQLDLEHQAQQHRYMATRWEQLLAEARRLPGFHNFLRPRKIQDLRRAASDGPVVIINAHVSRCDALIIFPEYEDIAHVPLDRFSHAKAVDCRTQIASMIGRRRDDDKSRGCTLDIDPEDDLRSLIVLWSDLVGPVLDALACTRKLPYNELPHVTWCATGALSFLPLHAAGLYDGVSPNAIELSVSSYTPTLSALIQQSTDRIDSHGGVLAVGQANLHGFSPLPKTVEELAIIKNQAKLVSFQKLDGPLATVEATLNAMEAHSWVHLACHAIQNRTDPSRSAFHLHDGELTLETIAKRAFKNKGLAFLSACQTATGDSSLPDESTHLAAGMLMAGYPSVIATMWSIMDDDAPKIAKEVYGELIRDEKMDRKNVARALHKAVNKLRENVGINSIGRWAPFIHIGA